jgi:dihydropteroate synthase
MELTSKGRTLRLTKKTGIVGVINVTPDSFVPASRAESSEAMLALASAHLDGGADILELGGESTGPHSPDVSLTQELDRVIPAVLLLRKQFPNTWITVDTYKSGVAREALAAGADIINDVTSGRADEAMFSVIADAHAPVVLMYAKDNSPRTTTMPVRYDDVVQTVKDFLVNRSELARQSGISKIILDPGLGHFVSSDPSYSWEILTRLAELCAIGPVLVSPSRKSFLAGPSALPASERLPATIAANCLAALGGAAFIRTHDVRQTRAALDAIAGIVR